MKSTRTVLTTGAMRTDTEERPAPTSGRGEAAGHTTSRASPAPRVRDAGTGCVPPAPWQACERRCCSPGDVKQRACPFLGRDGLEFHKAPLVSFHLDLGCTQVLPFSPKTPVKQNKNYLDQCPVIKNEHLEQNFGLFSSHLLYFSIVTTSMKSTSLPFFLSTTRDQVSALFP